MNIDFTKTTDGLIPAIIQDSHTQVVLMLGYMNKESFEKTVATKKVTFYSRSRKTLWTKGETSGNFLHVVSILVDCDNDTILIKARPDGPTCHTGNDTCFNETNTPAIDFLQYLENVIQTRKKQPVEGSYTNKLFEKGVNKIAQKVGEEAVELIIEAKDTNEELFLGEAADLMYHYLVLLAQKGYSLKDVTQVLEKRHK
ncbi:MAG TPA: bifunctional phosphoribosyl-AMP cyclohydrolase/phosphoribosyl-ATP diphosphatase HisIE [Bacteroidales bacterium]|jgi:phosphoribosyl-ATP pyrophosphohydrolase/phosphoribosyl-AMP cyclohydrolase|nr:bifunctional phosphoribosyl-AMP cyclohydrolase/phosphoribosyl-ATP diphosphatase HisIE [Bacteroidales bacterium]